MTPHGERDAAAAFADARARLGTAAQRLAARRKAFFPILVVPRAVGAPRAHCDLVAPLLRLAVSFAFAAPATDSRHRQFFYFLQIGFTAEQVVCY